MRKLAAKTEERIIKKQMSCKPNGDIGTKDTECRPVITAYKMNVPCEAKKLHRFIFAIAL